MKKEMESFKGQMGKQRNKFGVKFNQNVYQTKKVENLLHNKNVKEANLIVPKGKEKNNEKLINDNNKNYKTNKMKIGMRSRSDIGITLIALIVTIIVMLILAGVTISIAMGDNGIIKRAKESGKRYQEAAANETAQLDELEESIDSLGNESDSGVFSPSKWDRTATSEDAFIWGSDDASNENYGTVVGYNSSVKNYTILKYPSRCKKIIPDQKRFTIISERTSPEDSVYQNPDTEYVKNIQKVEIPETVVEIGMFAFSGLNNTTENFLENVKEISIPSSVTSIDEAAFYDSNFETIYLNEGLKEIGEYAFAKSQKLKKINIPKGIATIGNYVFSDCSSIEKIDIPDSVTSIGGRAFNYCNSLTEVSIPDSVISIGVGAFEDCDSLIEVSIPNATLESSAFSECDNLSKIILPSKLNKLMGEGVFKECPKLKDINLQDTSLTKINRFTFYRDSSLQNVIIPDTVQAIGDCAFSDCMSLNKIIIPQSVTQIDYMALGTYKTYINQTIYCRAQSKPGGWNNYWQARANVVWGYTGD